MFQLPKQIEIGPYTVHLDVLAARMQRRKRRIQQTMGGLLLILVLGVSAWQGLLYVRGTGILLVPEYPPDISLRLDDALLIAGTYQIRSGDHVVTAERTGSYAVQQQIHITKQQTQTLKLPQLRPIPVVQRLPMPHPGYMWSHMSPDAIGGWRLQANPILAANPPASRPGWGPQQSSVSPFLFHLDQQGLTRLSVLESYPIADELSMPNGARYWAMWEPSGSPTVSSVAGHLTIMTPTGTQTISTTNIIKSLSWSPHGNRLLVATPREQGFDVGLIDPVHPENNLESLITVSGQIKSIYWQPAGHAAVVITSSDQPQPAQPNTILRPTTSTENQTTPSALTLSAVLISVPESQPAHALRLRSPPARPGSLVPLAWDTHALWWVADTGMGLALEYINLNNDSIVRVGALPDDLVALTWLQELQVIRIVRKSPDGQLQVESWPEGTPLFTLPAIQSSASIGGNWFENELIVATEDSTVWYVQFELEALH